MEPPHKPIVHVHVPKTAGTSLRLAFSRLPGPPLRIFPSFDEKKISEADPKDYDVISGHIGYNTAIRFKGSMITLLRDPIERFVSVYYFWRELFERGVEVSRKTTLATRYPLDEFALMWDEPPLIEELFNRSTWQIGYGSSMEHRREYRDSAGTEEALLKLALSNLDNFDVVGVQHNIGSFQRQLRAIFSPDITITRNNVTESRPNLMDISLGTKRRIMEWNYLDLDLYLALIKSGRAGSPDIEP